VGTPRGKIPQYEKQWLALPWQKVRESVEVKLFAEEGELYVLARSAGRRAKERASRRRKLARWLKTLRKLRRSAPARDQLLLRMGAAKKEAGRAFGFVSIRLPQEGEEVTRQTFTFRFEKAKLQKAELRDGHYLLRSNLLGENPALLGECYVLLTQIEAAFRTLEERVGAASDLSPGGEARGSPHLRGLLGLCPFGDPQAAAGRLGAGPEAPRGAGKTGPDSDARCVLAYDRGTLADHAPLYPTGTRPLAAAAPAQFGLACTTAAPHQGPAGDRPALAPETENVVPTWDLALMKRKHLRLQHASNCESSASPPFAGQQFLGQGCT
jgi:hypothetical protein